MIVFMFAASSVAVAQGTATFKPGDRVEVDGTGIGWWSKGTVTRLDTIEGTFVGYWVKVDGTDSERRFGKTAKDIRAAANEPPPAIPANPNQPPANIPVVGNATGRFKVGERVQASPMAMSADEYFENCTVIKDYMLTEGYDTYRVLCDDPKGGKGQESTVKVPFIRRSASVGPPPKTPECPFNEPAGTVSRASKPSAALFKRVIYEWKVAISNGRKVGITFQSFQMGRSYRNVVLTVPGLGAQLKHTGAPLGATIYELKTTYLFCDKYTDSTIRWLVESQFACFKNEDGDWVCPVDSVPKYLEQVYLPNK